MTFATAAEYQSHYSARHMHSCSICKKNLPSSHILELHVLELHDTLFALMAEKNPMVSFNRTALVSILNLHLISPDFVVLVPQYQCFLESCQHKFSTPEDRKEHCLGEHKFSKKFHYWDCKPPRNLSVKVDTAKATGKNCTSTKGNKKQNAAQKANLQTLSNNILMEIDVASATVVQVEKLCKEGGSKSNSNGHVKASGSTMPKHIAFGRAPHRAFQNAYAAAIDPTKNKKVVTNEDDNSTLMDMKEVEDALVMSPDIDANKRN